MLRTSRHVEFVPNKSCAVAADQHEVSRTHAQPAPSGWPPTWQAEVIDENDKRVRPLVPIDSSVFHLLLARDSRFCTTSA
ncbi:MAG: hypothetical protein ACYC9J_13645 [Sulfuricaulis sp.]